MQYILLWDFDGTLAYRDGWWTSTLHKIIPKKYKIPKNKISPYMQNGFPWHEYEIPHKQLFKGLKWWEYMEAKLMRILFDLKVPEQEATILSKQFRKEYLDIKYWHLFPDSIRSLEKSLKKGYANYILSNHIPELKNIVKDLKIGKFIKKILNSADIGYEKPHCKFYQSAIRSIRTNPENLIMIGDNYISDITGARSCGIKAILVRSKNQFNYKYCSKNLDGIFEIIKNIR